MLTESFRQKMIRENHKSEKTNFKRKAIMRNFCRILVMVWSVLIMAGGILTFDFVNFLIGLILFLATYKE